MMVAKTKYDDQLENKAKFATLLQEQIGLLQRVREIELEINDLGFGLLLLVDVGELPTTNKKNRDIVSEAIPLTQVKSQVKAEVKAEAEDEDEHEQESAAVQPVQQPVRRRGRPKGTKNVKVADGDGKSINLPALLETIAQQVDRPLSLADFVTLAREAGYTTKSKDFSNMVYQSVLKLVNKGTFVKNEDRAYEYVGKAA